MGIKDERGRREKRGNMNEVECFTGRLERKGMMSVREIGGRSLNFEGVTLLIQDFTREILRNQPGNIYQFGKEYFASRLREERYVHNEGIQPA